MGLGALAVLWFAYARGVAKGLARSELAEDARSQHIEALYSLHNKEKEAWTRYGHARQEFERACWANEYRGTDDVVGALCARYAAERSATIAHAATIGAVDRLLRAHGRVGVIDADGRAASLANALAELDAQHQEDVEAIEAERARIREAAC